MALTRTLKNCKRVSMRFSDFQGASVELESVGSRSVVCVSSYSKAFQEILEALGYGIFRHFSGFQETSFRTSGFD